jgi:chromosome partitioning protein
MKVITFSAIKGGVGKSSLAILTSNYLSQSGYKVLCIDLDIQNSLTFYYYPEKLQDNEKNIFNAMSNNNLTDNIIVKGDLFRKIDIIPSDFNLIKLRSLNIKTLSRLRNQIENDYDYCVIDTPPTFDNIVLNALCFSDVIITPCFYSLFDYKALEFYKSQIEIETDKLSAWKILINRYRAPKTENPDTDLNSYIGLFDSVFSDNILNSKIPETTIIQKAIDSDKTKDNFKINKSEKKIKAYNAISDLCAELFGIENIPEYF